MYLGRQNGESASSEEQLRAVRKFQKMLRKAQLNQRTICRTTMPKGRICDMSGTTKVIRLNISGNVEGDIVLIQKTLCGSRLSKQPVCNISENSNGIKVKLPENIHEDFELDQKTLCPLRSSKGHIYNISGMDNSIKMKL